jgi:hydrogenase expression/formation protein HypE
MASLPIGKLPAALLQELLKRHVSAGGRVVVGPGIGQDAAILDLGDRYLVAKTDPITYATDEIGWYAVHINANDVACAGATPCWYLATVLLPEAAATRELAEAIFSQTRQACGQLGAAWCGGHTEVVHGLPRPIVVGQMLGEVASDKYLTSAGATVGDALILTKGFALEGTALVAREKAERARGVLSEAEVRRCANLLHDPGISVVKDARVAIAAGGVHALHDPTEGGLATGLWEMAEAAGVGVMIEQKRLPLLPECETLCRHFGLDPLGLIASGSLLIAAKKHQAEAIIERLNAEGIAAVIIGEAVVANNGCQLRTADGSVWPLPTFAADEITRLFAG